MNRSLINSRALTAISYVIEKNNVSKSNLAQIFQIKPAKFSEILNERMNVGIDIMAILCLQYRISAEWLLTGEGSMLKGGEAETEAAPQEDSHIIDMLQAQLAEKDKQIATLLNIISKMQ